MSRPPQTVYSKTAVRPGGSLEQRAAGPEVGSGTETVENVMAMADAIWGRVCQSGIEPSDKGNSEKLSLELHTKYKDFATTYPIAFRWMVHTREYDRDVFRSFITRHSKTMYSTRGEFLESQAQYLMMLYRKRNPRASGSHLRRHRAAVTKNLKEDDKTFQGAVEESADIVKKIEKDNAERRRANLLEWVSLQGAAGRPP